MKEWPVAASPGSPYQALVWTDVQPDAARAAAIGAEGAASAMAGSSAAAVAVAKPRPTAIRRPTRDVRDMT
jgi:hypothetical protein